MLKNRAASVLLVRASWSAKTSNVAIFQGAIVATVVGKTCLRFYSTTIRESHAETTESRRINSVGIQYLSPALQTQIFPGEKTVPSKVLEQLSQLHLTQHHLLGKKSTRFPVYNFSLPPLQGKSLTEHFKKIGECFAEPHLSRAKALASISLPSIPTSIRVASGWTRYDREGNVEPVPYPMENEIVFDVEVLYKISPFAVMACAASEKAWYTWLSPWLLEESKNDRNLIPMNPAGHLIIGHNISFDRKRILNEYSLQGSNNFFLDTMSLHIATHGMCSRQRPTWLKVQKERKLLEQLNDEDLLDEDIMDSHLFLSNLVESDPWLNHCATNSLKEVAKFHCNIDMNKAVRDEFATLDKAEILKDLQKLVLYCANDVDTTHKVYAKVFPRFVEVCPHPVTFAAMLRLCSLFLPVNSSWPAYVENCERIFKEVNEHVWHHLLQLAQDALDTQKKDPDAVKDDPWLSQLDWSSCNLHRKVKDQPAPPVVPRWYKQVYDTKKKKIIITPKTRLAPILLKLRWLNHPLVWSNEHGWTFSVEKDAVSEIKQLLDRKYVLCEISPTKDPNMDSVNYTFFKVSHKNGAAARCCNPLTKSYQKYFENGTLSSEFQLAKHALSMNATCSYWSSARDRIKNQMVVWNSDLEQNIDKRQPKDLGLILPSIIPIGTITRRAVENTWLTASNAKKNRLGSELKAMIKAPKGYCFVGADVDSEELWIASLIGDSQFALHGATALGWMTLEGEKSEKTDLHSKSADILGVTRDAAKIFNYGRIYGAGLKFTVQLLQQFNNSLTEEDAVKLATNLYNSTKGVSKRIRIEKNNGVKRENIWAGGTESFVFNKLEEMAEAHYPRTPVLEAGITEALLSKNLPRRSYMTSRINWAIQSSGVDYLHLLIISMEYLLKYFGIHARLAITVHDEIRYLTPWEERYRTAFALQIANLWTRAFFSHRLGINELPQSVAFFSSVDIDEVLRKDVQMDCVTPSNPIPIPPGEALNIDALLQKLSSEHAQYKGQPLIQPFHTPPDFYTIKSNPRPVTKTEIAYVKSQIVGNTLSNRKNTPLSRKPHTSV
ncbi:DNA polymerase [Schizosaccharomyces japonicus yFS275]|uniref:Mitochondrial DNA polymerase catalytic subunit n=1 Tax=Schizosaccharomyces japonicus (strain yFS275 / FY16936) TaxID=402676 RepID=B6K0U3_SCHJY|nr:DNA polymerase [Schizosaccharomyces japonicus yFS275]EEB07564.1 DNA polymerase [Schizosaccharomyces japonicus yFS275]